MVAPDKLEPSGCAEGCSHPHHRAHDYVRLGRELGELVTRKHASYGDSFGKSGDVLRLLYPDGIRPDQYRDALAIVRIVDKLFRLATARDAFGESPWRDIVGYGLLGVAATEARKVESAVGG